MSLERLPEIDQLLLTDVVLPEFHPLFGEACSVFAYLVQHPDGPILYDTGVGIGHAGIDKLYQPTHHSLVAALAVQGVAPSDVRALVISHLHFDHCGQNVLFPATPIYVQRLEFEAARNTPHYSIPEWIDFDGANYQLLDGDREILPGVTALATPGHTPGHQSVLVERADGRVLIAGHGAYSAEEFAGSATRPGGDWNEEAYEESLVSLRSLRPDLVYFSHDAVVWQRS